MNIFDLRMLSESADYQEVDSRMHIMALESADYSKELNEGMGDVGASESIEFACRKDIRQAKKTIREANKALKKGDKAGAKKKCDEAIKLLKQIRDEAEQIEDDGIIESMIIVFCIQFVLGGFGSIVWDLGMFAQTFMLRKQTNKGGMNYSNKYPYKDKNLIMEVLFGKFQSAGYSRAQVLTGLDRLISKAEKIKNSIK